MAGPPAAVAAVRWAVRSTLQTLPTGGTVLVACSGGPDSTALAAAAAFEAPRAGLVAGLVTVDHGLQAGSAERAAAVVHWALTQGFAFASARPVVVAGPGGPEAAARQARYAALDAVAASHDAAAVLLGHTADDQAETVLLGLARGSGSRSLAGMAPRRGIYHRPLLGLARAVTRAACAAESLPTWDDPHNVDSAYARSRVRAVLPALEAATGGGLIAGLARSARLLRADAELLDSLALEVAALATVPGPPAPAGGTGLACGVLAKAHPALRWRVLRRWAIELGAPPGALAAAHVEAMDALVMRWHGQGPADLPGGIRVARSAGVLRRCPGASEPTPS